MEGFILKQALNAIQLEFQYLLNQIYIVCVFKIKKVTPV